MRTAFGSDAFDELEVLSPARWSEGSDFDEDRALHGIRGRNGRRYDRAAARYFAGNDDGDDEPFDRFGKDIESLLSGDIGPDGACDLDEFDLDALDAFDPSSWEDHDE